jgi:hypothetical protein
MPKPFAASRSARTLPQEIIAGVTLAAPMIPLKQPAPERLCLHLRGSDGFPGQNGCISPAKSHYFAERSCGIAKSRTCRQTLRQAQEAIRLEQSGKY